MHTPEVLQGDCNETALLSITHVVGTQFGQPWRKVVQVERNNVEAEVVSLAPRHVSPHVDVEDVAARDVGQVELLLVA